MVSTQLPLPLSSPLYQTVNQTAAATSNSVMLLQVIAKVQAERQHQQQIAAEKDKAEKQFDQPAESSAPQVSEHMDTLSVVMQ